MTAIWLVKQSRYDDELSTVHCAFLVEGDARTYADMMPYVEVEQVALYGPGEQPSVVEAWVAEAEVPLPGRSGARSSPPKVRRELFSPAYEIPDWARETCALGECAVNDSRTLRISYRGSDRDAVLAACRARYDKAVEALA